jgi:hypothetical protein
VKCSAHLKLLCLWILHFETRLSLYCYGIRLSLLPPVKNLLYIYNRNVVLLATSLIYCNCINGFSWSDKVLLLLIQWTLILDRCPRCQRKDILKLHLQVNCSSCGYCYLKRNCPECTSLIANLDYSKRDIGQWVGCFTCRSCGTTYTDVINV